MLNKQGKREEDVLAILAQKSRDNSRTPVQWNSEQNAGFTNGSPWLEIAENYHEVNVEQALKSEHSVFYYYQRLIALRKEIKVITTGDYTDLAPEHAQLFCYRRRNDQQTLICINNYYGEPAEYELPVDLAVEQGKYILGNYPDLLSDEVTHLVKLKPYECRVLLIEH